MEIIPGHGLWFKGRFANGTVCNYERPFLVIETTATFIKALNVSSTKGKEAKLARPSNKRLRIHFPPFPAPSFVKLDELYIIDMFPELNHAIRDRRTLDPSVLREIIQFQIDYAQKRIVSEVRLDITELQQLNPSLFRTKIKP